MAAEATRSSISCAAGAVHHDLLSRFADGEVDTVSAPFGICVAFTEHERCVIERAGRRSRRSVPRGDVAFTGAEPIRWLEAREPSEVVEIVASESTRRALIDEIAPHARDLGDRPGRRDPVAWAVATRFRQAIVGTAHLSDLERDELVHHVYRHILVTELGGRPPGRGDGRLDAPRLGRVIEYVDAHLTDELTVSVLADVAALSRFHFLRSFTNAVGLTPHRFVSARRFERARWAIEAGEEVAAVARRYGFTHLRHFTRCYRRHHGVLPTDHQPPASREDVD